MTFQYEKRPTGPDDNNHQPQWGDPPTPYYGDPQHDPYYQTYFPSPNYPNSLSPYPAEYQAPRIDWQRPATPYSKGNEPYLAQAPNLGRASAGDLQSAPEFSECAERP